MGAFTSTWALEGDARYTLSSCTAPPQVCESGSRRFTRSQVSSLIPRVIAYVLGDRQVPAFYLLEMTLLSTKRPSLVRANLLNGETLTVLIIGPSTLRSRSHAQSVSTCLGPARALRLVERSANHRTLWIGSAKGFLFKSQCHKESGTRNETLYTLQEC